MESVYDNCICCNVQVYNVIYKSSQNKTVVMEVDERIDESNTFASRNDRNIICKIKANTVSIKTPD